MTFDFYFLIESVDKSIPYLSGDGVLCTVFKKSYLVSTQALLRKSIDPVFWEFFSNTLTATPWARIRVNVVTFIPLPPPHGLELGQCGYV